MSRLNHLAARLRRRFPRMGPLLTPGMIRFVRFGIVGTTGIAVNMGVLLLCMELLLRGWTSDISLPVIGRTLELRLLVGTIVAIVVSIFTNFLINNAWTWRDRSANAGPFLLRMSKYYMASAVGATINWSTTVALSVTLGTRLYLVWNLLGIALAMVSNFLINHYWTYRVAENEMPPLTELPIANAPPVVDAGEPRAQYQSLANGGDRR